MLRILPLVFLTTASLTIPQSTPPANPRPDGKEVALDKHSTAPDAKHVDGFLATWVVVSNNNTLALAQIAQQKSTDPVVKQFAQKVIEGHRKFLLEVEPFASGAGAKAITADRQDQTKQAQDASFERAGGAFDHVAMIQELGQQCLQTARGELEKKQGAEFDRCYMAMVVGTHMQANDMLTVFQKHASSPLGAVLKKGQSMVAMHLQEAKAAPAMEMEGKSTASRGNSAK